jgi:hypothetical protein
MGGDVAMRSRSSGPNGWDARLSTPGSPICTPDWLALREPADSAARDPELAAITAEGLGDERPLVIRDLGCGSGSLGRWLAPQLPGPQRWVLHDRDAELLGRAEAGLPATAADGTPVTALIEHGDLTDLDAAQLACTSLVAASALLDLLTAEEVDALADACTAAGCAALLTLSVTGSVGFFPAEPLDSVFGAAFDAHQRRTVESESGSRRLLGPDAGATAEQAFAKRGAMTEVRSSSWRLGPGWAGREWAELTEEWLRGWIAAACAQQPDLEAFAADYLHRRISASAAGELRVVVGHLDVLALPSAGRPLQGGTT